MEKVKSTYAVALTFSGEIDKVFNKLRADYQQYINYTIEPHITLIYPFVPVFSLFQVNEQLEKAAKRNKQFHIILNGIKFFENGNNVVYAAIQYRRAVKKLHIDMVESLDGLIKERFTDGKFNYEKFVPHVTIGERIPTSVFQDIKKRLSKYRLHYEDNITEFTLFSETNGDWKEKRIFELAMDTKRGSIF
jgi:2'-5' RNA ligase